MDTAITRMAADHRPGLSPLALRMVPPGLAVGLTALALGGAVALQGQAPALHTFLFGRGWTQPLTLLLFAWGFGHLARRWLVHRAEVDALQACAVIVRHAPLDRARVPELMQATADLLPASAAQVFQAVLSFFKNQRPTRDEVWRVANDAVDRCADRVDEDLRAVAACAWLIPLSGFLGTVLGMSRAIGSFHEVIRAEGGELAALLPSVDGLAVAFDTTLFALALVVPLKVLELTAQRRGAALVDAIDETVGTGLVRDLDLAGLAQQSPEEQALQGTAKTLERVRDSLAHIDRALANLGARAGGADDLWQAAAEVREAARAVRAGVPELQRDLRQMREQAEQPLMLVRGAPAPPDDRP